jgi:hypothetical protein
LSCALASVTSKWIVRSLWAPPRGSAGAARTPDRPKADAVEGAAVASSSAMPATSVARRGRGAGRGISSVNM